LHIFISDINEEFIKIDKIKTLLLNWQTSNPDSFKSAHAVVSIPEILSPLIRLEILTWNPLEVNL
jgi:GC-rich sequence DNA-binding factor